MQEACRSTSRYAFGNDSCAPVPCPPAPRAGTTWLGFADLNERLREHEALSPDDLTLEEMPLVNVLTFPESGAAEAFAAQMRQVGKDVDLPVHEPSYQRWTVVIHHADRAAAVPGLEYEAAAAHGGRHLGAF